MPPDTPVTWIMLTLVGMGAAGSFAALWWLYRLFSSMKQEIVDLLEKHRGEIDTDVANVRVGITALQAQDSILVERCHALELAGERMRASMAETYISKTSASESIARLAEEVGALRSSNDKRLASIEETLRRGVGRRTT